MSKVLAGLWAGLVLGVSAASCANAQGNSTADRIAPDPAILRGVLPNGLRYLVLSNAHPVGGVSIRLGVSVGSLDESDEERGAAHFVEHLAYDGLGGMAEAQLDHAFADAGVAFGRDRNAQTGYRATTYRIDLPKSDPAQLDLALRWLRHVADGAAFTDAAVDRERGVIMAEREARLDADHATAAAAERFEARGLRLVDREPIGQPATLQAMTAARLLAFYTRWYRPANAVLVVVGDRPAPILKAQLVKAFASWAAGGPTPPRPALGVVDEHRGLETLALTQPSHLTELDICRVRAGAPPVADDVAALRTRTRGALWSEILQVRLDRIVQDPASGVASAHILAEAPDPRSMRFACVAADPVGDDWRTAMAATQAEIARFAAGGPTQDELDAAVKGQRAAYRGAIVTAATRRSEALATTLLESELAGRTIPSPREAMRAFDAAVADLTAPDLADAFRSDWAGAGPLIVLVAPRPQEAKAVEAAWRTGASAAARTDRPLPALAAAWAYESFGTPGRVVRREHFANPTFSRFTFANGVVLNVMRSELEKSQARIEVVFGDGRRQISGHDLLTAETGATFFPYQGLGRHDFERIGELFRERTWGASLALGPDASTLHGAATTDGLRRELQLLAAYLSDPGFRDIDARLKTGVAHFERSYRTNPTLIAEASLADEIEPGSPGGLPDAARLARLNSAEFRRILAPLTTRSPIEVNIVGDVDEETVLQDVAETFGALAERSAPPPDRPDAWFQRFPDAPAPAPLRVTHQGPAEKAVALCVWPLYVARPERRREEYAISLLAAVFTDELRHRLRDAQGKTYAPRAVSSLPDFGDQGQLEVSIETAPADVDGAVEEARRVAAQLARGEITADQLEAVRSPRLSQIDKQAQSLEFWLDAIATSSRSPTALDDARGMRAAFASITLTEVRKAAADWLGRSPYVVIAAPPGATTTAVDHAAAVGR